MACFYVVYALIYLNLSAALPGHAAFMRPKSQRAIGGEGRLILTSLTQPAHMHLAYVEYKGQEGSTQTKNQLPPETDGCPQPTGILSSSSPTNPGGLRIRMHNEHKRQAGNFQGGVRSSSPSSDRASSLLNALEPAFRSALAPIQSAADTNLVGVSLVKSEAPSVLPTADVVGPAQSAAAPVLNGLLEEILSDAQPLFSDIVSVGSGVDQSTISLTEPLQSAIFAPVESAVGPLVSALAPAMVAAFSPADVQLSSPLGQVESSLIAPLEGAIIPVLSNMVGGAISALIGTEAPVSSLLTPVLGAVDDAVFPLVTSAVSAVWPTIGPAVTPLNPVVCALQPAEVPIGGNDTGLIPVQCVNVTSGSIIPVTTGIATHLIRSSTTTIIAVDQPTSFSSTNQLAPMPAYSMSIPVSTQENTFSFKFSPQLTGSTDEKPSVPPELSSAKPTAGIIAADPDSSNGSLILGPFSKVISSSISIRENFTSNQGPSRLTYIMAGATSASISGGQSISRAFLPSQSSLQSQRSPARSEPIESTLSPSSNPKLNSIPVSPEPGPSTPVQTTSSIPSGGTFDPSLAITPCPFGKQGAITLFTYESQTVCFLLVTLPNEAIIAGFMTDLLAQPVPIIVRGLARRIKPMSVASDLKGEDFAHELSAKLMGKRSLLRGVGNTELIEKTIGLSSKDLHSPWREEPYYEGIIMSCEAPWDGFNGPITYEKGLNQNAEANLQISTCPDANVTRFVSSYNNSCMIICDTNWMAQDIECLVTAGFAGCVSVRDDLNTEVAQILCIAAPTHSPSHSSAKFAFEAIVLDLNVSSTIRIQKIDVSTETVLPKDEAKTDDIGKKYRYGTEPISTSKTGLGGLVTVSPQLAMKTTKTRPIQLPNRSGCLGGEDTAKVTAVTAVTYASGSRIIAPLISATRVIEPAVIQPESRYISPGHNPSVDVLSHVKRRDASGIPDHFLNGTGADFELANDPIDPSTGILQVNETTEPFLFKLENVSHFSRDGGKGGVVNGQHVFAFADTAVYLSGDDDRKGHYVNYASSSVATEIRKNGVLGNHLILKDSPGEFASARGAIRGFAPLTTEETGFNAVTIQAGVDSKYSIWPESSFIPLNSSTSILIAPIVYSFVDDKTRSSKFTYCGNTLLTISASIESGAFAKRAASRLFNASEVEWGNAGGIRCWGASGIGGNDGYVYLFGNVRGGLLLARCEAMDVANVSSYEYWNGKEWTSEALNSNSNSYFLEGSFMDVDIFYSPRHLTFIVVYMNTYGDNNFYWRYLKAPHALIPSYAGGNSTAELAEAITQYPWSEESVLFNAGQGLGGGYAYAGSVHIGYFGDNDIQNGGEKLLITWTSPTGQDPASRNSAYQLGTGIINWT